MSRTTRPRGFSRYAPRDAALALIEAVQGVLAEYADFLPLTLRQVFYRLVGIDQIGKTERDYKGLCEICNRARRGGLLDFEDFRDDGLIITDGSNVTDANDALAVIRNSATAVTLDRQHGQAQRLQLWCEAGGMVPQLERIATPYGVTVISCGGFDSTTVKHDLALRLSEHNTEVLHIGDHDPSGVHMFQALAEDIQAFARAFNPDNYVEFTRLAVTPDQAREYDLPARPPKPTDNRRFDGNKTWQAEALPPDVLAGIVKDAITGRMDLDVWQGVREREADVRAELMERLP